MEKREFTSFDIAAVIYELKKRTLNSRVSNVYQMDSKTLLLRLHRANEPSLDLILEAGWRIHQTAYVQKRPETPPAFCMALRKYLRDSQLLDLGQHEFERVVILDLRTRDGMLRLVLELFGDGNIILVGEDGKILQALSYRRMRDRNILRSEAFQFAPSIGKNPSGIIRKEFWQGLKAFGDVEVVRAIVRLLSIGGIYAEEALTRTKIDKAKLCSQLTEDQADAVFDTIQGLQLKVTSGMLEPCVVLDSSGGFLSVAPVKLKQYETAGNRLQLYGSFNEALDEFYARAVPMEKTVSGMETDRLRREADRLKRIVAEQESTLVEVDSRVEQDVRIGHMIYAHTSEIQTLLDRFANGKQSGKEWKVVASEILTERQAGLAPAQLFESSDIRNLTINIRVDGLEFSLDLRRTLFENANRFYEHAKRIRQKAAGARTALEDSRRKLVDVEAKIHTAETLERTRPADLEKELAKRKVKQRDWFEKFRWFRSSDGFLVVAGKDAVSNEVLVKKHAENYDIVFHADILGAPFVVVKTEGKKASDQVLLEAAEFAAAFSRGWREDFGSVDVYWIKPEQLSKSAPSGESVPRGGFVVNGKRNWIRNVRLRTAVGVIIEDRDKEQSFRIIGGPVEAVSSKTNAYVTVAPGDRQGKELIKSILDVFTARMPKELREGIGDISIEEVRGHIPYSKGRILEARS